MKEFRFESIKIDDKNPNKHTAKGKRLIEKSIRELGFGRPIVLDKNNKIICGNGVFEVLQKIGKFNKVKVLETDGNEVIAVKRVDLDLEEEKGRKLSIVDNTIGLMDFDFDYDILRSFDINLEEWEITLPKFSEESGYQLELGEIIYVPRMDRKPEVRELYDSDYYYELIKKIEDLDIEEELKQFLRLAASRFIDYRFDLIAEFYAREERKEVKEIFEDLVLVILDYNKAIEKGLVKLWESYKELLEDED